MRDGTPTFNYRLVARLLGMLLNILAALMLLPIAVSVIYGDGSQFGLALSGLLILMLGLFLRNFPGQKASYQLHERESLWYTAIIWIVIPLMGALPYIFTGAVNNFTDAAFESFSGFTTTGSSVLRYVDEAPQGLLVWRSVTQWIGGVGFILFIVAFLRRLNEGSARLYEAEFSGTLQRRLHPRMAKNVVLMLAVYTSLTAVLFLLLLSDGNGFVDSLCTAMSTVSTGGFMNHSSGMAGFSAFSLSAVTLFMFFSGVNLAVLFYFFTFRWRKIRGNEEFFRYLIVFVVAVAVATVAFTLSGASVGHSLSFSLFHVASTLSTCGFYLDNSMVWPTTVSVMTFLLIFIGSSSGSTGGGIKLKRYMIIARHIRNYFVKMIHPRAVLCVKVNNDVVEPAYVRRIYNFVFLYFICVVAGAFVLTVCGEEIPNALCMSAANIGNLGPSPVINNLGANLNYIQLLPVAKWTMMLLMLAGRLEIFALVAVFMPSYWRR